MIMHTLAIGEKAPEFTLVGTNLNPIKLSDFERQILILHFFPLAFTSVCTAQMCTARDDKNDYSELDVAVLGVSVDSPFVLKKFAEENALNFSLASDFNRVTSKAYQVLFEGDFMGMTHFSKRSAFVIDGSGIIQYAEITDGKTLPDFQKIKNTVEDLKSIT